MKNTTPLKILIHIFLASAGLFLFGFGTYLTIQANIGAAPWDAFNLGLSGTFGIKYGTASITVSFLVLLIDILLKEKIGIGMILDAVIVGKTVDLFNYFDPVKLPETIIGSILIIIIALFICGFAQYLYMTAALGCGPRDTLLVGLSRKLPKIPIGLISICELAIVTAAGWALGGKIGLGTIICAFFTGPIMQFVFRLVHFNPTETEHQSFRDSFRILLKRQNT